MTCQACAKPTSGQYDFACLACCVRLVASARPIRQHQEAMLACIERYPFAPSREAITKELKHHEP